MNKIQLNKNQRQFIIGGIAAIFGLCLLKSGFTKYGQYKMNQICKRKRLLRDESIRQYKLTHTPCTISEVLKKKILVSTVQELKDMLYNKEFSVKQLLLFFIERVLDIGLKLNLITDINFVEALKLAEYQDNQIANDKEILKKFELFGIPISIKDTFLQKGFDNTYGLAARCFNPSTFDGIQVAHIKQAGGICFVRSNIPQLAMTFESVNYIFGRALNPWDTTRATGGSSGGEAALIASGCSVLGIGSDIAGSIRIPSAFCGIYGLKPGVGRQTEMGEGEMEAAARGMLNIRPTKGPLARSVDDLILLTRVLFRNDYYNKLEDVQKDFYWIPQELKDLPNRKLKVGYIYQFNELTPPNCMKRAVKEACDALQQQGHEVVEFKISNELSHGLVCAFPKLVSAEGGFRSFQDNLKGEKIIEEYELMEQGTNTPRWLMKYFLLPLLKLFGQKTLYTMGKQCLSTDVYGFLVNSGVQKEQNLEFLQQMRAENIDAIVLPGFGLPAVKHGFSKELPLAALYTWIWNTMDVPVGSMPITVVQEGQDQKIQGHEKTFDFIYYKMNESMKNSQGLPVNVQIVSFPYQEEVCLKVMKDIENGVKFNSKHPYPQ